MLPPSSPPAQGPNLRGSPSGTKGRCFVLIPQCSVFPPRPGREGACMGNKSALLREGWAGWGVKGQHEVGWGASNNSKSLERNLKNPRLVLSTNPSPCPSSWESSKVQVTLQVKEQKLQEGSAQFSPARHEGPGSNTHTTQAIVKGRGHGCGPPPCQSISGQTESNVSTVGPLRNSDPRLPPQRQRREKELETEASLVCEHSSTKHSCLQQERTTSSSRKQIFISKSRRNQTQYVKEMKPRRPHCLHRSSTTHHPGESADTQKK